MNAAATCLLALLMSGCAHTRVTEYTGDGWYMTAEGAVEGCAVTSIGEQAGCLRYAGKRCTYESEGCE